MKTTYKPYLIECITNLHVGSSGTNYGIVDNLVQRDPVTKFPTINASSLKGALKKHFEKKWDEENIALIPTIFGEEGKGATQGTIGTYNFLGADLLALPVRSNYMSYALAISLTNSKIINNKATLFFNDTKTLIEPAILGFKEDKFFENTSLPKIFLEDEEVETDSNFLPIINCEKLQSDINSRYAILIENTFNHFAENLPTVARNRVGENNNLWYEEFVPHKSLFVTFIATVKTDTIFEDALTNDVIQIGANASVGFGLCKFHELKTLS